MLQLIKIMQKIRNEYAETLQDLKQNYIKLTKEFEQVKSEIFEYIQKNI